MNILERLQEIENRGNYWAAEAKNEIERLWAALEEIRDTAPLSRVREVADAALRQD